jgi:hypothetical protein
MPWQSSNPMQIFYLRLLDSKAGPHYPRSDVFNLVPQLTLRLILHHSLLVPLPAHLQHIRLLQD